MYNGHPMGYEKDLPIAMTKHPAHDGTDNLSYDLGCSYGHTATTVRQILFGDTNDVIWMLADIYGAQTWRRAI